MFIVHNTGENHVLIVGIDVLCNVQPRVALTWTDSHTRRHEDSVLN